MDLSHNPAPVFFLQRLRKPEGTVQPVLLTGKKQKTDVRIRLQTRQNPGCLQQHRRAAFIIGQRIPLLGRRFGIIMGTDNQYILIAGLRVGSPLRNDIDPRRVHPVFI